MLSTQDNELLAHVGPGTMMGDVFRQYWLPLLLSSELPERDGPPVRVRVLGEDLVAFRDSNGDVGLLAANCARRGAALHVQALRELQLGPGARRRHRLQPFGLPAQQARPWQLRERAPQGHGGQDGRQASTLRGGGYRVR